MGFLDRLLTVAVTATLTSAAWILFGSNFALRETGATVPVGGGEVASPPSGDTTFPAAGSVAARSLDTEDIQPVARAPVGELIVPVQGVRPGDLTDTFSDDRGGGTRLHEALDIMAPRGTRVLAAAPGTVEKLFKSDAGGNTVYVRSPDRRTIYYYAHLDGYAPTLSEGQFVSRGEVLGTVGSTGNASPDAPHLHFAIMQTTPTSKWWDPATAVNPYPLLAGAPSRP